MNRRIIFNIFFIVIGLSCNSQSFKHKYWQQKIDYKIQVLVDPQKSSYQGNEKITYKNNSPNILKTLYLHLYNNAYQPGSDMDIFINNTPEPDIKFIKTDRQNERGFIGKISLLSESDKGYIEVKNISQNGITLNSKVNGTILEIKLDQALYPNSTTVIDLNFNAQIPQLISEMGKNSEEGIELTMTKWYPAMAVYDKDGWHIDQYLGRGDYNSWADFDVAISIDKKYIIASSGKLINTKEMVSEYTKSDLGLEADTDDSIQDSDLISILNSDPDTISDSTQKNLKPNSQINNNYLTWNFVAKNILEFSWAADPNYTHEKYNINSGPVLHFFYKNNKENQNKWSKLKPIVAKFFDFYMKNIGKYPYDTYSIIQAGNTTWTSSMCLFTDTTSSIETLTTSLAETIAKNWIQQSISIDGKKYAWLKNGFSQFISNWAIRSLDKEKNPFGNSYLQYYNLISENIEQPLATNSYQFNTNRAYRLSTESKASLYFSQLSYLIGWEKTIQSVKSFYNNYQFKYASPNNFNEIAENISGLSLAWYLKTWSQTTQFIDYAVDKVEKVDNDKSIISLNRIGKMEMPISVLVTYKDGNMELFYIPISSMPVEEISPFKNINTTILSAWGWANSNYIFTIDKPKDSIKSISIDPSQFMADINLKNNIHKE